MNVKYLTYCKASAMLQIVRCLTERLFHSIKSEDNTMEDIRETILEQLQQLQMMMHRAWFHHAGGMHNPHRGQGRVLAILKLKPEISQRELTYLLNMSKQAVGELIAKLEKSGDITRTPSEEDKRAMIIRLTPQGAKAAEAVDRSSNETNRLFDCFTEDELSTFSGYLERMIDRYEADLQGEAFAQRRRHMEDLLSMHGREERRRRGFDRAYGRPERRPVGRGRRNGGTDNDHDDGSDE